MKTDFVIYACNEYPNCKHLFKLRLKNDAQQETREVVELMLDQVKENGSFKKSLKAFEL